jgi:hypothetical protein
VSRNVVVLIAVWALGVGYGMHRLWQYKTTAGAKAEARSSWPASTKLTRSPDHATLVMMAHPYCPCTRASVSELSVLMTQLQGRVSAYVVFDIPESETADFEENDLWRTAAAIPGVTVVRDDGGAEAARFGAKTSGQTFVFDPEGTLLFSGGITGARGHAGDNLGRKWIVDLVRTGKSDGAQTAVFGCGLEDPTTSGGGGKLP